MECLWNPSESLWNRPESSRQTYWNILGQTVWFLERKSIVERKEESYEFDHFLFRPSAHLACTVIRPFVIWLIVVRNMFFGLHSRDPLHFCVRNNTRYRITPWRLGSVASYDTNTLNINNYSIYCLKFPPVNKFKLPELFLKTGFSHALTRCLTPH